MNMCMKLICLMLVFGMNLNGCTYFADMVGARFPDPSFKVSWSKKGFSDEEVRRFSRTVCASRGAGMRRSSMSRDLLVQLEIEKQTCMFKHGFIFRDASWPDVKMCSKSYAESLGIKSYMIFPVCQAKYGRYKK